MLGNEEVCTTPSGAGPATTSSNIPSRRKDTVTDDKLVKQAFTDNKEKAQLMISNTVFFWEGANIAMLARHVR